MPPKGSLGPGPGLDPAWHLLPPGTPLAEVTAANPQHCEKPNARQGQWQRRKRVYPYHSYHAYYPYHACHACKPGDGQQV